MTTKTEPLLTFDAAVIKFGPVGRRASEFYAEELGLAWGEAESLPYAHAGRLGEETYNRGEWKHADPVVEEYDEYLDELRHG